MASKYFKDHELQCHGENPENYQAYGFDCGCGCGSSGADLIHEKLLELLDTARYNYGKPLSLSCAFRCDVHNQRVGGVVGSEHTKGLAADVVCPDDLSVEDFACFLERCMDALGIQGGVGRYPDNGFVHIDVCEEPPNRRW